MKNYLLMSVPTETGFVVSAVHFFDLSKFLEENPDATILSMPNKR